MLFHSQLDLFQFAEDISSLIHGVFLQCVTVSLQCVGVSIQSMGVSLQCVGVSVQSVGVSLQSILSVTVVFQPYYPQKCT